MPGENDRLAWQADGDLTKFLKREMGATRPILLLVYGPGMAKDCCAANFERALFRDEEIVALAGKFICVKHDASVGESAPLLAPYKLEAKKPAILLLDGEAGLLHLQQRCINPPDYVKAVKSALRLNDVRVTLFAKHMGSYQTARAHMGKQEYGKALKELTTLHAKREQVLGSIQVMVDRARTELVTAAEEMMGQAGKLEQEQQLVSSMRLYKKVAEEFVSQPEIGLKASREARRISGLLHRMGLPGA